MFETCDAHDRAMVVYNYGSRNGCPICEEIDSLNHKIEKLEDEKHDMENEMQDMKDRMDEHE